MSLPSMVGAPTPYQEKVLAWLSTATEGRASISGGQISPCRGLHNRGYLLLTGRSGSWHVTITPLGRTFVHDRGRLERPNGQKEAEK